MPSSSAASPLGKSCRGSAPARRERRSLRPAAAMPATWSRPPRPSFNGSRARPHLGYLPPGRRRLLACRTQRTQPQRHPGLPAVVHRQQGHRVLPTAYGEAPPSETAPATRAGRAARPPPDRPRPPTPNSGRGHHRPALRSLLSRVVRLTVDDVVRNGDQVLRRLGEPPSPAPRPAADLLFSWIDNRDNMNTATNRDSRWRFPGRRAGQPMPAPVVADALGHHHVTTAKLAAQAGATWSRHASGGQLRSPSGWSPREPTTVDWATSPVGEAVSAFARPGICHSGGVSGGGRPAQLGTRPQQTPKHDALRFRREATARTTLPGACRRAGD